MLKGSYLALLRSGKLGNCRYLLVMRGRGNDDLAPSEQLLDDFLSCKKILEREYGKGSTEAHNKAYQQVDYEKRFRQQIMNSPKSIQRLKELKEQSQYEDIYLICYEGPEKKCHRNLLIDIANNLKT